MKQSEPVEALRTLSATVYDTSGVLLPAAATWLAGMVQISIAGGAFADATNLPTSVSGGGDGDFDLVLTVEEVSTIGNIRVRFYDDVLHTNLLAEYVDQVITSTTTTSSSGSSGNNWTMFGCGITRADVLALAPALSTLSDAAWVIILAFINTFEGIVCDPQLKKLALTFLAAHIGAIIKGGSSGATGAVLSETAGSLKRTYGQLTTLTQATTNATFYQTPYGQQFLGILSMSHSTRGPFLV